MQPEAAACISGMHEAGCAPDESLASPSSITKCLASCGAGVSIEWGEFGVGGGASPYGDQATTAEEAARLPFFGVPGPYA